MTPGVDITWNNKLLSHSITQSFVATDANPLGTGSDGYADFVFRAAAREIYNIPIDETSLPWQRGRNNDIQEVELKVSFYVIPVKPFD